MNFRPSCSNLGPMGQLDRGTVRFRHVVFVGFVHALLATCLPTTWVMQQNAIKKQEKMVTLSLHEAPPHRVNEEMSSLQVHVLILHI